MKIPLSQDSLFSLRRSAAYGLAAVVHKLSPKSQLIRTTVTNLGFECEFTPNKILRHSSLEVLEEFLRELSSESIPLVIKEMLADNAAQYLRSKGYTETASAALESSGYVIDVLEIGNFITISSGAVVETTANLRCLKLLSMEEGETIIISGIVAPNSKELKSFNKNLQKRGEWDSTFFLKELEWIIPQDEGLFLMRKPLVEVENKLLVLLQENFEPIDPEPLSVLEYPLKKCPENAFFTYRATLSQESDYWSLDGIKNQFCCKQNLLLSPYDSEKLISHLQFICNWIKIFPLQGNWILCRYGKASKRLKSSWEHLESKLRLAADKCQISLSPEIAFDEEATDFLGPRIDFVVRDRLGREWKTAYSGLFVPEKDPLESRGPDCLLQTSPFGGIERFIALLLEECRRDGKVQDGQLAGSTQEKRFNALEQLLPPGFAYRKSN